MGTTDIANKILSDAREEADEALKKAQGKAREILEKAERDAEQKKAESLAFGKKQAEDIAERKAASARLECAKIELAERHRVIDGIYERALKKLVELSKEDCLAFTAKLLEEYAEAGDEVYFAENYLYAQSVKTLPVVAKKQLKISTKRLDIQGGFVLKGEKSDKDLSYEKLLLEDKQEFSGKVLTRFYK